MSEPVHAKDHRLEPDRERVALSDRLALRVGEAAALLGLSETAFRDHLLARCPRFNAGRVVLIPVRTLEEFVESLAAEESGSAGEIVSRVPSRRGRVG